MNVSAKKHIVYHISPLRLWLATGMFIVFAILMLVLAGLDSNDSNSTNAFRVVGLFLLACAAMMYLLLRYSRLVLSSEGVKLYQVGYKLETTWDNVANLYDTPGAQGLILHHPMDCRGAFVLRAFRNIRTVPGMKFYRDEQIQLIAERRFIPTEAFAYWLKHGQLRDDVMRRAPSLIAESDR